MSETTPTTTPGVPDDAQRTKRVIAAIVALLQAANACGFLAAKYADWITGNEAIVGLAVAAVLGAIQTFLPSAKKPKIDPAKAATVMVLVLALPMLAGCSYKGWTIGLGTVSRTTETYTASATVMPDSTSDSIHTQATFTRKDGNVPDVKATVTRPSPNTAQVDVWASGFAQPTPANKPTGVPLAK